MLFLTVVTAIAEYVVLFHPDAPSWFRFFVLIFSLGLVDGAVFSRTFLVCPLGLPRPLPPALRTVVPGDSAQFLQELVVDFEVILRVRLRVVLLVAVCVVSLLVLGFRFLEVPAGVGVVADVDV